MKKLFFIFLCGAGGGWHLCSQMNLIRNSSFEIHYKVPVTYSFTGSSNYTSTTQGGYIIDWFSPYFNGYYLSDSSPTFNPICDGHYNSVNIPNNFMGYQQSKDGHFFICMMFHTLACYKYFTNGCPKYGYSSIICSQLIDTLIKNHVYEFTLYWNKPNTCQIASNQLQAYFTPTVRTVPYRMTVDGLDTVGIDYPKTYSSQVAWNDNIFMTDTLNWIPLNGCFKARGDELYVSILNARDTTDTKWIDVGYNSVVCADGSLPCNNNNNLGTLFIKTAFYYIDDLSLYDRGYYGENALARPDTLICPSVSIALGTNDSSAAHYQWYPSLFLDCDTCPNPIASPTITTAYVVKKYICNYATYDTVTIYVAPAPSPVSIIKDTSVCFPVSLHLAGADSSAPFTQYLWSPSDFLSCINCPNPVFNPPDTGSYHYVFTQNFCNTRTDKDSVNIRVMFCEHTDVWDIPNIFTPNNDGVNDGWGIQFKYPFLVKEFHLEIYDRWGVKMFESDKPNAVWDGRTISGEDVPTGTYFYTAEFILNNKKEKLKGYITLMR